MAAPLTPSTTSLPATPRSASRAAVLSLTHAPESRSIWASAQPPAPGANAKPPPQRGAGEAVGKSGARGVRRFARVVFGEYSPGLA